MRNSIIATLIASAFLTVNAGASDLLQIYKVALANDAQYGSARASQMAGQEKMVQARCDSSNSAYTGLGRAGEDRDVQGEVGQAA